MEDLSGRRTSVRATFSKRFNLLMKANEAKLNHGNIEIKFSTLQWRVLEEIQN